MSDAPICLTLPAEATLGADGKPSGFRGVAYSGGIAKTSKWGNLVIDLTGIRLPRGKSSMLLNHDPNQIVGRAKLVNDGCALAINDGSFSAITTAGKEVAGLMAEGQDWELSVGVNPEKLERVDRSKTVTVNGQQLTGVDTIFRASRMLETSFVPSGADPEAYAAQLSARHPHETPEGGNMPDAINPLQARVTELEAQVATLTGERDTARTELATANAAATLAAKARRKEQMTALFGDATESKLTAEQIAAYEGMSDAQFAAVETTLAAARTAAGDPTLFRARPSGGLNHEDPTETRATFSAPLGAAVDPERAQLHAKILKHQADHPGVDYVTAALAVAH